MLTSLFWWMAWKKTRNISKTSRPTGCKKYPIPEPGEVDFNIDLTDPEYSDLQKSGRMFVYIDDIIVAHLSDGSYIAASRVCTHKKCFTEFDEDNQNFPCPTHGAIFDLEGIAIKGPAKKPVFIYNTELIDNELRIYS